MLRKRHDRFERDGDLREIRSSCLLHVSFSPQSHWLKKTNNGHSGRTVHDFDMCQKATLKKAFLNGSYHPRLCENY